MDIKELLQASVKEGVELNLEETFDLEGVSTQLNESINGIVTKNVKGEKDKLAKEVFTNFTSELGIEAEDMDGVKLWAKRMNGNTDEFKEANTKLTKELSELKEKYGTTEAELQEIKQQALFQNRMTTIMSEGFSADEAEFIEFKLGKQVTEEQSFDDLFKEYINENKPKTNNRFRKRETSDTDDVPESIKKKYPKYFKK